MRPVTDEVWDKYIRQIRQEVKSQFFTQLFGHEINEQVKNIENELHLIIYIIDKSRQTLLEQTDKTCSFADVGPTGHNCCRNNAKLHLSVPL